MSEQHCFGDPQGLTWSVELPDRCQATLMGHRPRATLVIWPDDEREERRSIPVAVARQLKSKGATGEIQADTRSELLHQLRSQEHSCAHARLERLLDRRDYSSTELQRKFAEDGYEAPIVDELIERAEAAHLVSDTRYAEVFIRSKINAGWGINKIVAELARRGIDVDGLAGWPYDYLDPDDELSRAIELADRKYVSGGNAYPKLVRYLVSRGFSTGVAHRAARASLESDVA